MQKRTAIVLLVAAAAAGAWLATGRQPSEGAGQARLMAWNDLGMQEIEADYAVYAVQPPGNKLRAQLVDASGHLVKTSDAARLTFEAVADPSGSVNATSIGKSNFWTHAQDLFGLIGPQRKDTGSKFFMKGRDFFRQQRKGKDVIQLG